jgi:hypothetical protein
MEKFFVESRIQLLPGPRTSPQDHCRCRDARVLTVDAGADKKALAPSTADTNTEAGVHAVISTPLASSKNNLLGMLSLHFREP